MSEIGKFVWQDLTVEDAGEVKDFYSVVVGWEAEAVSMGDYEDYNIIRPGGDTTPIAGICYRRGSNRHIPAQWLNYVMVESVDKSIESCKAMGGKVVDGPRPMDKYKFVIIEDPAGAVLALLEEVSG